jgi:polysaccharide pyruvyl transferase WcaK-like protein
MTKVAHFGTFDVDNYGDLLFPHLTEFRLPHYQWEHISPTIDFTVFKDSKPIISFEEAKKNKYDAIVIGGGNIIHLLQNIFTVYKSIIGFSYANLWVGAAKIAVDQKIPYVFNTPGLSHINGFIPKKIACSVFKNSNYLAFREKFSKEIVLSLFKSKLSLSSEISIVPDTAFDIDRLWPLEPLEGSDYITVNLNGRYHCAIKDTARNLDKISRTLNMSIKFIIIGACHGDKGFTDKVSKEMKTEHEIIDSNSLKKLAYIIGNGKYFLGSSMHGFITALSYGVSTLLVLNNRPAHKFVGLLEITELKNNVICSSFAAALNNINSPAILSYKTKLKIQSDLDNHWNKIDKIIKSKKSLRADLYISKYESLLSLNLKLYRILKKLNLRK